MDPLDDFEWEPYETFYLRLMCFLDKEKKYQGGGEKAADFLLRWKKFVGITDADIAWYREQQHPPSYYDGATWEEVGAAWAKIKVNYETYQASKQPTGD